MSISRTRMMVSALIGAGMNINTSNWFGPKGSTGNKYKPHQGAQEVARRLSKMKCGKVNNGHACTMPKGSECPDCCGIRGETIGEGD